MNLSFWMLGCQALSVVPVGQVATACQSDALLFAALARAAERRVGDFKPQELANAAWAFATACQYVALLFAVFKRAVERRVGDFKAQNLANTA